MKVVILCGGLGTRLREETEYRPKPMVPIGGRPILWHIMKSYAHHGFKEFVLCLGYKGEVIKDYFRNYLWHTSDVTLRLGKNPAIKYHRLSEEEDWTVTLLDTGAETQTGGRLRQALPHVTGDDFFFTYGDAVTDVDLAAELAFHRAHGAVATVTAVRPSGRFGEMSLEGDAVMAFLEKPEQEQPYVNGGFMVLSTRIKQYLGTDDRCIFERGPMESVVAAGQLKAFRHNGFWQCMDTYREQQLLDRLWHEGGAPWKLWR